MRLYRRLGACNAPPQKAGRMQCAPTEDRAHEMRPHRRPGACNAPPQKAGRMQCAPTEGWARAMRPHHRLSVLEIADQLGVLVQVGRCLLQV